MATLHALCGFPGSGKTTFALALAKETRALRLANDDWVIALFGNDLSESQFRVAVRKIECLQWDIASQLFALGIDVIWDYGVWSRDERAVLSTKCAQIGAELLIYDIRCDFDLAVRRVIARHAESPGTTLFINREAMEYFRSKYQPPTADEGFSIRTIQG